MIVNKVEAILHLLYSFDPDVKICFTFSKDSCKVFVSLFVQVINIAMQR